MDISDLSMVSIIDSKTIPEVTIDIAINGVPGVIQMANSIRGDHKSVISGYLNNIISVSIDTSRGLSILL